MPCFFVSCETGIYLDLKTPQVILYMSAIEAMRMNTQRGVEQSGSSSGS